MHSAFAMVTGLITMDRQNINAFSSVNILGICHPSFNILAYQSFLFILLQSQIIVPQISINVASLQNEMAFA